MDIRFSVTYHIQIARFYFINTEKKDSDTKKYNEWVKKKLL